jgi:hypothetical protein
MDFGRAIRPKKSRPLQIVAGHGHDRFLVDRYRSRRDAPNHRTFDGRAGNEREQPTHDDPKRAGTKRD